MNWRITLKDKPYIEFLDEFGKKVVLTREFYGFQAADWNGFSIEKEPYFELFDGEEVIRTDIGDIFVMSKNGELINK